MASGSRFEWGIVGRRSEAVQSGGALRISNFKFEIRDLRFEISRLRAAFYCATTTDRSAPSLRAQQTALRPERLAV